MTADQYVVQIVSKYSVKTGPGSTAEFTANLFKPTIIDWAHQWLVGMYFSGSYAKGTAVAGGLANATNIDLFVSLKQDTPGTLNELYESLFAKIAAGPWNPERQNVSIGIQSGQVSVDLVPARLQPNARTDHSLYRRRGDTWMKTNVATHEQYVKGSGRVIEIRVLKIWKRLHNLEFLSFYLELFTIEALRGRPTNQPAANVFHVLNQLSTTFKSTRILDPANTANIISDQHTDAEKGKIAAQAAKSAAAPNWGQIIW